MGYPFCSTLHHSGLKLNDHKISIGKYAAAFGPKGCVISSDSWEAVVKLGDAPPSLVVVRGQLDVLKIYISPPVIGYQSEKYGWNM